MKGVRCWRTRLNLLFIFNRRKWRSKKKAPILAPPVIFFQGRTQRDFFFFNFHRPSVFFTRRHTIYHTYMCMCHMVCVHLRACQALTGLYVQGWGLSLNCLPASPDSTITLPGCPFWALEQHTHRFTWPSARIHIHKAYTMSPHIWHTTGVRFGRLTLMLILILHLQTANTLCQYLP